MKNILFILLLFSLFSCKSPIELNKLHRSWKIDTVYYEKGIRMYNGSSVPSSNFEIYELICEDSLVNGDTVVLYEMKNHLVKKLK
jgi:hypothetical protein